MLVLQAAPKLGGVSPATFPFVPWMNNRQKIAINTPVLHGYTAHPRQCGATQKRVAKAKQPMAKA